MVALVHADIDDDDHWLRLLDYRSDTIVTVAALESGHSADTNGEVTVLCRDRRQQNSSNIVNEQHPRLSSYFYRTTDKATFIRQQTV